MPFKEILEITGLVRITSPPCSPCLFMLLCTFSQNMYLGPVCVPGVVCRARLCLHHPDVQTACGSNTTCHLSTHTTHYVQCKPSSPVHGYLCSLVTCNCKSLFPVIKAGNVLQSIMQVTWFALLEQITLAV